MAKGNIPIFDKSGSAARPIAINGEALEDVEVKLNGLHSQLSAFALLISESGADIFRDGELGAGLLDLEERLRNQLVNLRALIKKAPTCAT